MSIRRWILRFAPFAMLVLFLALRVIDPPFGQQARNLVFDSYQRFQPRQIDVGASRVRVIDIDDQTLARHGQWPWPRTKLAALAKRLHDAGALVVGFDMVFAEPDRTSPHTLVPTWPKTPEVNALREKLSTLPDHDKEFATAIASLRAVTGFVLTGPNTARAPAARGGFGFAGENPAQYVFTFQGAVPNIRLIEAAARGNGALNWVPDIDQVVRRVPIVLRLHNQLYPTFFAEILRVAQDASAYKIRSSQGSGVASFGSRTGIVAIQVGGATVPTDANGQLLLYYAPRDPRRTIPAWRILDKSFDPETVRGKILLIGVGAAGLVDLRSTPLEPAMAGVEVHAQAIEQVIAGEFLIRPDYADALELAYILVFGLLVLLIVPRVNAAWGIVVGFVAVAAAFGTAWILFTQARWVIDGLYPGVAVALVFVTTALTAYLRSEQQREQVRGAFGRYLAPALVERLADNPEQLVLGGEIRDMTILFSDIRGFTSISEQYDAGGLTRFMNAYLTPMTSTILDRGGTVDKYMGDAIMAFWNAPIDDADHAENACRAALEMTERLRGLNETWRKEAEADGRLHLPVEIGIGLNSGPCCVGNMGSEQRFDYSVLGDDVNLASRLEGQCKYYGTAIIIGESTHAKIDAFATLELDLIRVKGKTEPRRIHALLGDDSLLARPAFKVLAESHAKMLDDYRNRRWTAAADSLAECRKYATDSLHALYELYAARIRAFQRTPPPADWDGVYVAEEK